MLLFYSIIYGEIIYLHMNEYDTCFGYDTYSICRYVYFKNNRIRYVIDMRYMNVEKWVQ